jgi:hypothetical protein
MSTAAFWWALLKALPTLIALLSAIADRAQSARDRREGYDESVRDSIRAAHDGLLQATEAFNQAREQHKADPTDDAFDKQFMRND